MTGLICWREQKENEKSDDVDVRSNLLHNDESQRSLPFCAGQRRSKCVWNSNSNSNSIDQYRHETINIELLACV